MSVLVRLSVSGMTTDSYDKASEQLTPPLLAAPGFVSTARTLTTLIALGAALLPCAPRFVT